jgi:hypothetical protein
MRDSLLDLVSSIIYQVTTVKQYFKVVLFGRTSDRLGRKEIIRHRLNLVTYLGQQSVYN